MRLSSALVALPAIVLAQVVTVTEYPDSCKATYTTAVTYTATSSGARTSTVVQSTVTVVPTPFTDSSINEGAPFAIEIQPAAYSKEKRQAQESRTFLDVNGYLTSDASEAVQYVINNGQVRLSGGQGQVTANETDLSIPFAASSSLKSIRTTFFSKNLHLGWNNSAFDGGAAEFFQVQQGTSTRIVAHLSGVHDASWIAVNFALQPPPEVVESSTIAPVPSSTGNSSIQPISSTATSASATPSSNVNPSGACGVGTNNNNCFGAPNGSCCSQYGFCGTGPEYCGAGCQTGFGTCDPAASSPMSTSAWIQLPTTIASSAPIQPPVIDSSSAAASSSGALPPTYQSSISVGSLAESLSTVALTIPAIGTVTSAEATLSYGSSSAGVAPILSPSTVASPVVSTLASTSYSTSRSATSTSFSFIAVTSTQGTSNETGGTPIVSSQYPSIASEKPWFTESIGTPSFSLVETGSSIAPIYPSLASSYASSISSEVSSWSSAMSSASSNIDLAPSYQAPSSAPTAASSASSAASSISSVISSISSAASSVVSRSSSSLSSVSSRPQSAASSSSSAAQSPPMYTAPASTTIVSATTISRPASITSSGLVPTGTGVGQCPEDNGLLATDANGVQYVVGCSADFIGTDISSTRITSPYTSCYALCDGIPSCGGYIWAGIDGSANGFGTGYCYFKAFAGAGNFVSAANTLVAVVKPTYISGYSAPTSAPPAYTSDAVATPTAESSTPVVSPSQASSCAATALLNPQFYASESASRASSWLVLPSPTPCDFGDPPDWPIDDSYCNIDIPQGLELYASSFTTAFASTNGVIAFGEGTAQYENQRLNVPTDFIPPFALAPFWDDQAIFGNETQRQGIYYQTDNTGVTIEFYLSRPYVSQLIFHYTVSYSFANPGVWVFRYFDLDSVDNDDGIYATVGMQGVTSNNVSLSFEYSYKTRSIYPGLVLTCDTNSNICTSCTQQV